MKPDLFDHNAEWLSNLVQIRVKLGLTYISSRDLLPAHLE